MIFQSEDYCSIDNLGYEGLFEHDKGTEQIIIKDNLINEESVAQPRAIAELLNGGYNQRWITLSTIYISGLKPNSLIEYGGVVWIVKEISLSFKPPKLTQTIKGLRYE